MLRAYAVLEQEIIARYFSQHSADADVEIGVGDDAAVVQPPDGSKLVMTMDTLNEGVHFHPDCRPEDLGHKALAVNLSDLAAMGAAPLWATLSLSLPEIEDSWLEGFSRGLYSLADRYNTKIIGGDLVRGARSISMQATGYLESGRAITRAGARPEDFLYVTGTLGDAALSLQLSQNRDNSTASKQDLDYLSARLNRPQPRVDVGQEIVAFASAAIDLSDGLVLDVQRILQGSGVGARIELEKIPRSDAMQRQWQDGEDWNLVLAGGDDYELVFTAGEGHSAEIDTISTKTGCPITRIGQVTPGDTLELFLDGRSYPLPERPGFEHFT